MKLLVIGGTRFVGRAIVAEALSHGHQVTLFNRGQSNPDLFAAAEQLIGDRDGGLAILRGRTWDAVVDTCGYLPRLVRDSAALLAGAVGHYTFISSISVYDNPAPEGVDEDSPLGTLADPSVETIDGDTYGPLKVLCEQAVDEAMNGRALHIRAGLIVGPHDPTERFVYWPRRVAAGGEMLAPGGPAHAVQFIDARDLAAWTIQATGEGRRGPFNVTGPAEPLGMGGLLTACREATGAEVRFTWVPDDFLLQQGVRPWSDLPLWIPAGEAGLMRARIDRALAAGLTYRPLVATVRDTLVWDRARPAEARTGGLTLRPERERDILTAWHAARPA